ncbi:MAG: hypothetical protein IJ519_04810, partial [Clostridia bacterium]|nr:hypothetical protein [Clostridia bacterium]
MNMRSFNEIKRILAVTLVLSLAILCIACGQADTSTEGQTPESVETHTGEGTTAAEPTEPTPTDPTDPEDVDQFINDNFGDYGE